MIDSKNINDYISITIHNGKEDVFSIVEIKAEKMDFSTSPDIKSAIVTYFLNEAYKKSGATKHALDMSKVTYITTDGLSAVLLFNRFSEIKGYGRISLVNCNNTIDRLIKIAQLDTLFEVKSKTGDL